MKHNLTKAAITLLIPLLFACSDKSQSTEPRTFQDIHDEATLVDGHNDFLYFIVDELIADYTENRPIDFGSDLTGLTHLDLARQKEGGLDVQFFSVFCLGSQVDPYQMAIRQIDSLDGIISRNSDAMALVRTSQELQAALIEGKSVAMIGVEGGHMIEDDLEKLQALYDRGSRYLTLTWNNSNSWARSSYDEEATTKGLTDFGKEVVAKMNELGMIVDISHVGEQTFWDVMELSNKPVMASHSSVRELCDFHRNLKDDQIKAVAENGGVVMVNFYSGFIDSAFWESERLFFERHKEESDSLLEIYDDEWLVEYILYGKYKEESDAMRPPLSKLIDHIDYIVKLVGVDYVGLGSDFDGITSAPKQLDDVTDFPVITKALLEKGYSEEDVKKILGENFLRVLKANEAE